MSRTDIQYPCHKVFKIAQINVPEGSSIVLSISSFAVGCIVDTNTRQIALSVLENLREDLIHARLNNGCRVLDVADLRQYIYEQMGRIRTTAYAMDGLYGSHSGHGQEIRKSNGHNGNAHP
jgi:hypothetical protein